MTAHPDDVDFGFAGTVAKLTTRGSEFTYGIGPTANAAPRRYAESRWRPSGEKSTGSGRGGACTPALSAATRL